MFIYLWIINFIMKRFIERDHVILEIYVFVNMTYDLHMFCYL